MPSTDPPPSPTPDVRDTYLEYTVGPTTIATIADPENSAAWIQSTLTVAIEP